METELVRVQRVDRTNATVARQVRAARGLLAWSQAELAAHAGIAQRTLADIETGRRVPRDGTIERLKATLARFDIEMFDEAGRVGVAMRACDGDAIDDPA